MEKSERVLRMLKKIPKGKVTTYGELARAAKSSPRAVGQIMRRNDHPETYPCYKVVSSTGAVHGYSGQLKGKKVDRKVLLLRKEGITLENGKIDLRKHMHRFT